MSILQCWIKKKYLIPKRFLPDEFLLNEGISDGDISLVL